MLRVSGSPSGSVVLPVTQCKFSIMVPGHIRDADFYLVAIAVASLGGPLFKFETLCFTILSGFLGCRIAPGMAGYQRESDR